MAVHRLPARLACLLALALLAGCAGHGKPTAPPPAPVQADAPERPFAGSTLYDLLVAEVAGHRGDYDIALKNYLRQARQTRDPGVIARAVRLAEYLTAWKPAVAAGQLWVDAEPDSLEAHYSYGIALAKTGQLTAAFDQMRRVGALGGQTGFSPIAVEALRAPAQARKALLGQIDDALTGNTGDGDSDLLLAKAIIIQRDDPEAALALAQQARKRAPESTRALIVESDLLQQLKRSDDAAVLLARALAVAPDNLRLRLQYARILTRVDLPRAKQQFELLNARAPGDPDLIFSLGLISRELKQYDEAETYFRQLLATGARRSEARYYLGLLAERQGRTDAAADHFRQVTPGPDFLRAMAGLAQIRIAAGQLDQWRQFIADQRQKYRDQSERLYVLEADVLVKTDHADDASQLLTRAIRDDGEQLSLLYTRAVVNEKRGRFQAMESDLRKVLSRDPDNAAALNALGYTLTNHSTRYTEALAMISRALEQRPDDPTVLDSMGWVQYRLGHRERALHYLQRAYKAFPDPEIAAHLGEVLWQDGQRDAARRIWHDALQRAPGNSAVTGTMRRLLAEHPSGSDGTP